LALPTTPPAATEALLPPPVFGGGSWNIASKGSSVMRAFDLTYRLPQPIHVENREALASFGRDQDVPVLWDPHGYSTEDRITIELSTDGAGSLTCSSPASDGRLVFPAELLKQLSPSGAGPGYLSITAGPQSPAIYRVDLNVGSIPVLVRYTFTDTLRPVIK